MHNTAALAQKVNHRIISTCNLQAIQGGHYQATTDDPSLLISLDLDPQLLDGGDFHIKMHTMVWAEYEVIISKIYLPTSSEYSQKEKISRSFANGEGQEFCIHRENALGQIRYDPVAKPGLINIRFIAFYAWSEAASYSLIRRDYARRHRSPTDHYRNRSKKLEFGEINNCTTFEKTYSMYKGSEREPLQASYALWAKYIERSSLIKKPEILAEQTTVKFSVLVPVYNTNPEYLRQCIESVLSQTYPNWELCIVDDCSSRQETKDELELISRLDSRIKVLYRKTNGHISIATNDALELATGDRVCFLDHDDVLPAHALQTLSIELLKNPNLLLIYSDEDFINSEGNRINPHFKTDWNKTLLYSHNYITHFVCVTASRARAIGGLRIGTEGAQDYDFLLRYTEDLLPSQIYHIPEILYHWRKSETSVAGSSDAKPYTVASGLKALTDHFIVSNKQVTIEKLAQDNFFLVRPKTDEQEPLISIIIPTKNCASLPKRCIESIYSKTTYKNYEIIIVDNGSNDYETLYYLKSLKKSSMSSKAIRILQLDIPFNYSKLNNYAFEQSNGDLVCLLNNDTEVIEPEWLTIMQEHAISTETGCVGAKLLYKDNTLQHAGIILSLGGIAGHSHKGLPNDSLGYFMRPHLTQELSAVTGACLLVRSEVFRAVNGLDETLFAIAYNDVDFCLKVKSLGLKNIYCPNAVLYHHESKSRGYEDTPEKLLRFQREQTNLVHTWGDLLKEDSCYNPNLTKDKEDFSIRIG
ncbi:MAG: glycosyltransferase family 2 protein [Bacteroidia bacterium]